MSFQDDAIEPLAVESAQHFTELLRRAGERERGDKFQETERARLDPRRVLPRELGN